MDLEASDVVIGEGMCRICGRGIRTSPGIIHSGCPTCAVKRGTGRGDGISRRPEGKPRIHRTAVEASIGRRIVTRLSRARRGTCGERRPTRKNQQTSANCRECYDVFHPLTPGLRHMNQSARSNGRLPGAPSFG